MEIILNRIASRELQLQRLVARVTLSRQAALIFASRRRDNPIDFDARIAMLRYRQFAYLALVGVTGVLALTRPWIATLSGTGIQNAVPSLLAMVFLCGAHISGRERWLRSRVARLGLATELLGLVDRHPAVRAYVECAVELYPWLSGLDVELARVLAKHEETPSLAKVAREADAMEKLSQLPYSTDMEP